MSQRSKAASAIGWILASLLAFVFLDVGYGKIVSQRIYVHEFAMIGIGQWFRYFVGILEVAGAIGVLIPRCRFWAASGLAAIMVGATIINIGILHAPPLVRLTVFLLAIALALAWLRRPVTVGAQELPDRTVVRRNSGTATS